MLTFANKTAGSRNPARRPTTADKAYADSRITNMHPAAIAQRNHAETINQSPLVSQLQAYQEMANDGPQARRLSSFQAMANQGSARPNLQLAAQPAQRQAGYARHHTLENRNGAAQNVIQRVKHTPEEIMGAVGDIAFGGTLFEEKIILNSEQQSEQQVTLNAIIDRRLALLSEQIDEFDDTQYTALQISYAADVVAEQIAKSAHVNVPRMKDKIASLLLTHFGDDINTAFGEEHNHASSIAMATALAGKDPVELYIKKMIPLNVAAAQIDQVAQATDQEAAAVLKMYRQRFQNKVLGFSREQVEAGQASALYHGAPDFPIKELVGHLSTGLHDYVSNTAQNYQISENYGWTDGIDQRFAELAAALNPEHHAPGDGVGIDEPPHMASLRTLLPEKLQDNAPRYWDRMAQQINNMPIVIIVKSEHLQTVENTPADHMDYQSMIELMLEDRSMAELIKPGTESAETVPALKRFGVASQLPMVGPVLANRAKTYGPWREEKDTRAAQTELNQGQYPTFGFVPYYPYNLVGAFVNTYYGDTLLQVADTKKAGARYKWTDQGKLHNSASEALKEVAVKDKFEFLAAATYLIHGNMTLHPSTKLEAIVSGRIVIPGDIDKIIVSKDSEIDSLFNKDTAKTADSDLMNDVTWWENSEILKAKLAQGEGGGFLPEIFADSRNQVITRNEILDSLNTYDENTAAQTGVFSKSANPDKQRIQTVCTALQNPDYRTWAVPLKQFIDTATPGMLSTPKKELGKLRVLYGQLLHAEDGKQVINTGLKQ